MINIITIVAVVIGDITFVQSYLFVDRKKLDIFANMNMDMDMNMNMKEEEEKEEERKRGMKKESQVILHPLLSFSSSILLLLLLLVLP